MFSKLYHADDIKLVLVRHEQGATHAADGYARVTGKASVVLSHLGPGLSNAATGVANAALDCIPMVVIAGDIPSHYYGKHPHQEVNLHADGAQCEIYRPFVKRVWRVERPELFGRLADLLEDQGDGAPFRVAVGDRQRDALTLVVDAQEIAYLPTTSPPEAASISDAMPSLGSGISNVPSATSRSIASRRAARPLPSRGPRSRRPTRSLMKREIHGPRALLHVIVTAVESPLDWRPISSKILAPGIGVVSSVTM